MKPAPKWFLERFADRYDIKDTTVQFQLAILWRVLKEGKKVRETDEWMLDEEFEKGRLTTYGSKLKQRRKRTAQIAKASRKEQRRAAATTRRRRQRRNRRYA